MGNKPTIEQVKMAAGASNFYIDTEGTFSRIQYLGDDDFNIYYKDTDEVRSVSYEDARHGQFYHLVQYQY
jgi:hypothetical protein